MLRKNIGKLESWKIGMIPIFSNCNIPLFQEEILEDWKIGINLSREIVGLLEFWNIGVGQL